MKRILQNIVLLLIGIYIISSHPIQAIAIYVNTDEISIEENKKSKTYTTAVGTETEEESSEQEVEEIEQEIVEETTELSVDPETSMEEDEVVNSRSLAPNEIIVNSYLEFRSLVEKNGDGIYDTYYMGADFSVAAIGIRVPDNYSFTLDGTNPITGERHKYNEVEGGTFYLRIYGTSRVEFKNMDIISYNTTGVMDVNGDAATVIMNNVTYIGPIVISNGTRSSEIIIKDSYIEGNGTLYNSTIIKGKKLILEGKTTMKSVIGSNSVALSIRDGSITIAENAEVTFILSKDLTNAAKEVNIHPGAQVHFDLVYSDTTQGRFAKVIDAQTVVMDNAKLTVKSNNVEEAFTAFIWANDLLIENTEINLELENIQSPFRVEKSTKIVGSSIDITAESTGSAVFFGGTLATAFNIDDTSININITDKSQQIINTGADIVLNNVQMDASINYVSSSTIQTRKKVEILNGSNLKLRVDIMRSHTVLAPSGFSLKNSRFDFKLYNQTVTNTSLSVIQTTNSSVHLEDSQFDVYIHDSDFKQVFTATSFKFIDSGMNDAYFLFDTYYRTSLFHIANVPVSITTQQLNVWERQGEIPTIPTQEEMPVVRMVKEDYGIASADFKINAQGIATFSTNEFDSDTQKEMKLNYFRRLSMGTMELNVDNQESNATFSGRTNPQTDVRMSYQDEVVVEGVSSEDGTFNFLLDPPAVGDYQNVEVFSNYLYRQEVVDYTMFGTLELIEYPTELHFSQLGVTQGPKVYSRDSKMKLVIEDGRPVQAGWKLEAKLKTPLSDSLNVKPSLNDALIFKEDNQTPSVILSDQEVLIYETTDTYDKITTLEFEIDEGILIELLSANGVYKDVAYTAEIEWILTEY